MLITGCKTTLAIITLTLIASASTYAAIESRDVLKTYFETGDTPTTQSFVLINSALSLFDEDITMERVEQVSDFPLLGFSTTNPSGRMGIRSSGTTQKLIAYGLGATIGPIATGEILLTEGSLGSDASWLGSSGFIGFEFDMGPAGQQTTHYGFIHLQVYDAASATPYAVRINTIAWETSDNTAITTFVTSAVPLPASVWLFSTAIIALSGVKLQTVAY